MNENKPPALKVISQIKGLNNPPLIVAVQDEDIEAFKRLLEAGEAVESTNSLGQTALMFIISFLKAEKMFVFYQLLTAYHPDISHQDIHGNTALIYAAIRGLPYMIEDLFHRGANINHKNLDRKDALFLAIKHKRLSSICAIITFNPTITQAHWNLASKLKNKDFLLFSLYGRWLFEVDKNLARATLTLKELLSQDKHIHNRLLGNGDIPLTHAARKYGIKAFDAVRNATNHSISKKDSHGHDALDAALVGMNRDMVRHLVNLGCTVNKDHYDFASKIGMKDVLKDAHYDYQRSLALALNDLKSEAEPHPASSKKKKKKKRKNKNKNKALQATDHPIENNQPIASGVAALYEPLPAIPNREDINIRDAKGRTLFFRIVQAENVDPELKLSFLKALVQHGADINIANKRKTTPLMIATLSNNLDLITLLIELGADMTLKNKQGSRALDLANKHATRTVLNQQWEAMIAAKRPQQSPPTTIEQTSEAHNSLLAGTEARSASTDAEAETIQHTQRQAATEQTQAEDETAIGEPIMHSSQTKTSIHPYNVINDPMSSILSLVSQLKGQSHQAYIYGGALRDLTLFAHYVPSRIDIITSRNTQEILSLLPTARASQFVEGLCTYKPDDKLYFIRYSPLISVSLNDFAHTCDFTCNTLFMDEHRNILDPLKKALNDIKQQVIRLAKPIQHPTLTSITLLLRAIRFRLTKPMVLSPTLRNLVVTLPKTQPNNTMVQSEWFKLNQVLHANKQYPLWLYQQYGITFDEHPIQFPASSLSSITPTH